MTSKRFLITITAVLVVCLGLAQDRVEVSLVQKEMSKGEQTAFMVFIPEAETKMVENQWKKFINERSLFEFAAKGTSQTVERAIIGISNIFSKEKRSFKKNSMKVEKIGEELVVKGVIHEEVTNKHIDVYARITSSGNGVNLSSFYQYSDSIFINEFNVSQDVILSLKNYIREFGIETFQKVVEKQIFEQRKEVRKQEGILRNLENKNKSLHNSIGRYETEIDESYNTIRLIEMDLERIEKSIAENKAKLATYKRKTEAYEIQRDILKSVEKEYKSEYNKIKSQKNKIKRNQTRIRKANADILINEKDQELQQIEVELAKSNLSTLENKLADI